MVQGLALHSRAHMAAALVSYTPILDSDVTMYHRLCLYWEQDDSKGCAICAMCKQLYSSVHLEGFLFGNIKYIDNPVRRRSLMVREQAIWVY